MKIYLTFRPMVISYETIATLLQRPINLKKLPGNSLEIKNACDYSKILNSIFGPLNLKLFKFEKSFKSAMKKCSYNPNFRNLHEKLRLVRTDCSLFGTACTLNLG